MDRWGIRRSIFVGVLIIGLSATLRSLSGGFFSFLIFVALFGVGGPMISIGCPKTISQWSKGKERATAVGIYTTGPWIGGMASLAAANVAATLQGHPVWTGSEVLPFLEGTPPAAAPSIVNAAELGLA